MIGFMRGLAVPFWGTAEVDTVEEEATPQIGELDAILASTNAFTKTAAEKSSTNQPFWARAKSAVSDLRMATKQADDSVQQVEDAYTEAKSNWENLRKLADAVGGSVGENVASFQQKIDAELAELETAYREAMRSTRSHRKAATVAIKTHSGSDRFARSAAKASEVAFKLHATVQSVDPEVKQATLLGFQINSSKTAVVDSLCKAIMDPVQNGRDVLKTLEAELGKIEKQLQD